MGKIKPDSKARFGTTQLNMIYVVVRFALSAVNLPITSSISMFLALINALSNKLTTIQNLMAVIALPITGFADHKRALKNALAVMSAPIMKAVRTYAIDTNNQPLADAMVMSVSKLKKMKDVDLVSYVQDAINMVTPVVGSLSGYGVTVTDVTVWQSTQAQFSNVVSDPRNAIANRASINENIQALLRECMVILYNQCDELAFQFKLNNLNYYNGYRHSRKLIPHVKHTKLRAYVQTEVDQPLHAEVIIDDTGVSGFTDPDTGFVNLTSPEIMGEHTVTVVTGANSKTFGPFDFKKGKSLTKYFVVAPDYGLILNPSLKEKDLNSPAFG